MLCIVIFAGPGWLVHPYWDRCFETNEEGVCTAWNPYHTNVLYENEQSIQWWTSKNLEAKDFDNDSL